MHICVAFILTILLSAAAQTEQLITLGPFGDQETMDNVYLILESNYIPVSSREDVLSESMGFIVVSGVVENADAARRLRDELRDNGIADTVYMQRGPYAERVSLGVFGSRVNAAKRASGLNEIGFDMEIFERTRTVFTGWLDLGVGAMPARVVDEIETAAHVILADLIEYKTTAPVIEEPEPIEEISPPAPPPQAPEVVVPVIEPEPIEEISPPVPLPQAPEVLAPLIEAEAEPIEEISPPVPLPQAPEVLAPLIEAEAEPIEEISPPITLPQAPEVKPPVIEPEEFWSSDIVKIILGVLFGAAAMALIVFSVGRRSQSRHVSDILFDDTAESEKREQLLQELRDEIEAENNAKLGGLPATVDDELREPMSALQSFADVIKGGDSPGREDMGKYLDTIASSGDDELSLIDDIFDLSQLESGRMTVDNVSFDVNSVIDEALRTLSSKAEAKDIVLKFSSANVFPNLIQSDAAKLKQILISIISYAIDSTDSGKVDVKLGFVISNNVSRLSILVSNAGAALSKRQITDLFDPLAESSGPPGQGVRLAISRHFAKALGGDITVRSEPDRDNVMSLTINAEPMNADHLLLPSGISVNELVESEAEAKALSESQARALEEANKQLERGADERITFERSKTAEIEALTIELAEAKAQAASAIAEPQANGKMTALKDEVDAAKTSALAAEPDGTLAEKESMVAVLLTRVESLTADLGAARAIAEEAEARAEFETADGEPALAAELEETRKELAAETTARAETDAAIKAQTEKQAILLVQATKAATETEAARLEAENLAKTQTQALETAREELKRHADAEAKANDELGKLKKQLEGLQASALTQAEAQEEIANLQHELARSQQREQEVAATREAAAGKLAEVQSAPKTIEEISKVLVARSKANIPYPVRSTRSTNNPILRGMVEHFVVRLEQQLIVMETAFVDEAYADLAGALAWLKGEAFSLGFKEFTNPVNDLEELIRIQSYASFPSVMSNLKELAGRIVLDEADAEAADSTVQTEDETVIAGQDKEDIETIEYEFSARKAELAENFLFQFGSYLLRMESSLQRDAFSELKNPCRWIMRYATTLDFYDVIQTTNDLEKAVDGKDQDDVAAKLKQLVSVYSRIKVTRV